MTARPTGSGHDAHAGRTDDAGRFEDRPYENLRSLTSRAWGEAPAHEDRFGHEGLAGYGDFREHGEGGHSPSANTRGAGAREDGGRTGGQRGRGPRSAASRGDHLIAEEINERLMHDERVDAGEILLIVEDGVVTLTGEVPERRMKHLAEDIADSVRGVRELRNLIRVDRGSDSFGPPGEAWRSGNSQKGSGFSSESANRSGDREDTRGR